MAHPYVEAVLGDTPLHYWQLGQDGAASAGSTAVALTGATIGVPGPLTHEDVGATSFDGVNDFGKVEMDLTAEDAITVEFWLAWDAFANNDDLAMEFTRNFNDVAGGFIVDPNDGNGLGIGIAHGRASGRNASFFARPSAAAWHHYVCLFDMNAAAANQVIPYVDGVKQSFAKGGSTGTGEPNFTAEALYLMSRKGEALFGAGDLAHIAVYSGILTEETIVDHFEAAAAEEGPEEEEHEEEEPDPAPEFDDARLGWHAESEGSPLQRNFADGE